MARVIRAPYRYTDDFIVVRPVRLTRKEILQPGEELDKEIFRRHHIRSLYLRRRIGVLDSEWSLEMLANLGDAHARPEAAIRELPVEDGQANGETDSETNEEESENKEQKEEMETTEEEQEVISEKEEPVDLTDHIHKEGRRWHVDHADHDGTTFKTKKAAMDKAEELLGK